MSTHWDDPSLAVRSDSARTARYRRLQSWYRDVQLQAGPGEAKGHPELGSMLRRDDVLAQPDLNFLDPAAFSHAEQRIREVPGENGSLEVVRLRHNLLSSMPLCFNLFGALGAEPRRASFLALFQQLFDAGATTITGVTCEWAPPSEDQRIGDRTAFDAVVHYERAAGPAVLGIETKYTEPFSQHRYEPTDRYKVVSRGCGWYADPERALAKLQQPASNQLWRNLMLAGAIDMSGTARAAVAVVALDGDKGAAKALTAVRAELAPDHQDRLLDVSLETIVAAAATDPALAGWSDRFRRRYLAVDQPDDPGATEDPTGPRLGRELTTP